MPSAASGAILVTLEHAARALSHHLAPTGGGGGAGRGGGGVGEAHVTRAHAGEAHVIPQSLLSLQAQLATFWEGWEAAARREGAHGLAARRGGALGAEELLDLLHVAAFHSKLRALGEQAASLAWRVAHIRQKLHPAPPQLVLPSRRYGVAPSDLYAHMPVV